LVPRAVPAPAALSSCVGKALATAEDFSVVGASLR
jgi:hypothetical protein